MSVWLRAVAASTLALAMVVAAPALAQPDAKRAEVINDEGKELFHNEEYRAAIERFERAIRIQPDPRYHLNLCLALYMVGDVHDALAACEEIRPAEADDELLEKRAKVMAWIDEELEALENEPAPEETQDPESPSDTAPPPESEPTGEPASYEERRADSESARERRERRMGPQISEEPEIHQDYNWSLGGELGGYGNMGVGGDRYQDGGLHFRLFADFIVSPQNRLGLEAYANFSRFRQTDTELSDIRSLNISDLGGGVFQHFPLTRNIYFTPFVGGHFAIQQPDDGQVTFVTFGARGEASFDFVFGKDDQHTLSVTPVGLNLYLPVTGAERGVSADTYGLNQGSATYTFTAGYAMRFAEPFGESVITLE